MNKKRTMSGHFYSLKSRGGQVPEVIITDKDNALRNALDIVFPITSKFLCIWNIEKNVLANCRKDFDTQEEFDLFMSD
jgi:hypothetical protein